MYEHGDKGLTNPLSRDAYMVNVRLDISKATWFGVQVMQAEDYKNSVDTGGMAIAYGLQHKLAKSTTVYLVGLSTTNDDNSSFGTSQGGIADKQRAAIAGVDVTAFSMGMVHKF